MGRGRKSLHAWPEDSPAQQQVEEKYRKGALQQVLTKIKLLQGSGVHANCLRVLTFLGPSFGPPGAGA